MGKFEYLVNGKKVPSNKLTTTPIGQAFGRSEYVVAGSYPDDEEINELEVIVKSQKNVVESISMKPCDPRGQRATENCFPNLSNTDKRTETEVFLNRLWASKRINYLLNQKKDCTRALGTRIGILRSGQTEDACKSEALNLALEYNFVTDLTSIVIEDDDKYVKKGPVPVNRNPIGITPRTSGISSKIPSSTPSRPLIPFAGTQQSGQKV